MAIPKFYEFFPCIMDLFSDDNIHSFKETKEHCALVFNTSQEERNIVTKSGGKKFDHWVNWACVYLKKAGLLQTVKRGFYAITDEGKKAVLGGTQKIDLKFLENYDSFLEFKKPKTSEKSETAEALAVTEQNPQEAIENAINELNSSLADELTEEIMRISPYDFERLVTKLLIKMGYGTMELNADATTKKSGDEGIDGIIKGDKFGFEKIYIQAKQWKKDYPVGRPEIQKFAGALMGQGAQKGLFITTSYFSGEAIKYAQNIHERKIVLVDGKKLCELMIEYNLGVSTVTTYEIKRIDYDFFSEDI